MIPPERAWGLWVSRQIVARIMGTFGPTLAGTRVESVDVRLPDGRRVKGEWVYGPRTPTSEFKRSSMSDGAIYYVHGSGYAVCSPKTHRRLTSWLSALTGLPVFCVDYRLAPRHRFPTAADDVRAGWDWLVNTCGVPPKRIVIAGDSAGGHLSVDMLLQPDIDHPAAQVLLSPLYDLTFELSLAREQIRPDPATRAASAVRLVGLYHNGVDLTHQRLTLDVAGGPALPPTLIQAGGAEMLQEDARQLATDIQTAGGRCELQIWPHQVHVFQALPRITPEAAKAMAYVARFIAHALQDARTVTEEAH
ncbi:acetyl hydrolase [Mycobacterium mantenii]|uniref:Acetyl hydrolase n=1 Tax=Mycobacterium mantenii TaxID=560555 RepID=A0A1A2TQ71_MYCNT|nr:acetyl hydrolase [Mycobacterium mantenii]OBH78177.1 acetyl hydrolase [Mycobacterium mantenii]